MPLLKEAFEKELPHIEKNLNLLLKKLPETIQEIALHTSSSGGKRIRPFLVFLTAQLLTKKNENIYPLCSSIEILHLASLLHDDVIDNAKIRRNTKTAHEIYGSRFAILTGDALLAHGCHIIAQYHCSELMNAYSKAIVQTIQGELEEIKYQGSLEHSIDIYYEIISGKTAYLLRSSTELGGIYAQKVMNEAVTDSQIQALADFGHNLGMAFQLIDDVLDFFPEKQTGKPQGGDIKEGKATLPILLYYQNISKEKAQFFKEKFEKTKKENSFTDKEIKEICQEVIEKNYIKITQEKAKEYLEKATQALACFENSKEKEIMLALVHSVALRNK